MDLFEVLFVVVFLLIPVLEGVLRKRRGAPPEEPAEEEQGPASRPAAASEEVEAGGRTSGPASDMLPDDLWEVLTGQRRERAPVSGDTPEWYEEAEAEEAEGAERVEAWSTEPAWASEGGEPVVREPVSLEYAGPEAYSLEQPLDSPEVRHARFHDRIDRKEIAADGRRPPKRRSSLARALRSPRGIRDAVILAELLGRPKGLE